MQVRFVDRTIEYDGTQLSSHWALKNFDLQGDSIVAFIGPCNVRRQKLVDLVDRKRNQPILSEEMLHFIAEFFDLDLEKAILRQRLLISLIKESLDAIIRNADLVLVRKGDDIYAQGGGEQMRKLSVSIATLSPVSTLIHVGLNIKSEKAPVPAIGLKKIGIDARILADQILQSFREEIAGVRLARAKVKGVP
ncbi:MAG: DUF366 family protein [Actinomycetota bacterium]